MLRMTILKSERGKHTRDRQRTLRRFAFGAALLAMAMGMLSGCGNNPYPAGETQGSILYRTMGDDPRYLDPSRSYTLDEGAVVDVIYPAYFRYHFLKRNPFVLELNLGAVEPKREPYRFTIQEKGRAVQKTGESWTFRIKPGLRFQDDPCFPGGKGRAITAADIIYSFRRMADPSVKCPVLAFFQDKIIGFDDYVKNNSKRIMAKQKADYSAPVAGLQLDPKDPLTFRILLNQPYPQLRYLMTMHFTTPQAHEAIEKYGKEIARHPVGCGPYLLAEYKSKQRLVLKANPNRPNETYPTAGMPGDRKAGLLRDAGKRLPLVETVVYNIVKEDVTGWNLFLQGYMDAWGVTQNNYQQVMSRPGQLSPEMKQRGISLERDVSANVNYFAFNMDDPVVGGYTQRGRKLRQAISTAIDAQDFIDLFNQGNGVVAQSIVPPGIYGYDAGFRNPYRQHSVERAKKLLAEAGYPGGKDAKTGERLTLYYDNTATDAAGRQYVGLVKKQIEAIGLHVESRSWRSNVWQDRLDKGQFQFAKYGWYADYPDPENFVFLLYGPNRRPGVNYANYNNPEYNRLFEQMRSMDDGPQRLALIRRLRAIATEDCPWIYLNHDINLSLTQPWRTNVKPHPVANDITKYAGVDGERRSGLQVQWNRPIVWPAAILLLLLGVGSIPAARVVRSRGSRRVRRHSPGQPPTEVPGASVSGDGSRSSAAGSAAASSAGLAASAIVSTPAGATSHGPLAGEVEDAVISADGVGAAAGSDAAAASDTSVADAAEAKATGHGKITEDSR